MEPDQDPDEELDAAFRQIDELQAKVQSLERENRKLTSLSDSEPLAPLQPPLVTPTGGMATASYPMTDQSKGMLLMRRAMADIKDRLHIETEETLLEEKDRLQDELKEAQEKASKLEKQAKELKAKAVRPEQELQQTMARLREVEQEHETLRQQFTLQRQASQRQIRDLEEQLEASFAQQFSAPGLQRGSTNSLAAQLGRSSFQGDSPAEQLGGLDDDGAEEEADASEMIVGGGAVAASSGPDPLEMARLARESVRLRSQLASAEEALESERLRADRAQRGKMAAKWQMSAIRASKRRLEESGVREDNQGRRDQLAADRESASQEVSTLQAREAEPRAAQKEAETELQAEMEEVRRERAHLSRRLELAEAELQQRRPAESPRPLESATSSPREVEAWEDFGKLQAEVSRHRGATCAAAGREVCNADAARSFATHEELKGFDSRASFEIEDARRNLRPNAAPDRHQVMFIALRQTRCVDRCSDSCTIA